MLSLLSPLLQSQRQNMHATFITLFINAVKEAVKMGDPMDETPDIEFLTKSSVSSGASSPVDGRCRHVEDIRCARFSTRRGQVFRKANPDDQNCHAEANYSLDILCSAILSKSPLTCALR
jgi:hypothetical protein